MAKTRRLESNSWSRIVPAGLWGGLAGAVAQPVYNIPVGSDGYFWRVKAIEFLIGLVIGLLLYLLQRLFKINRVISAIWLSGIRIALVLVIVNFPPHGTIGTVIGSLVGTALSGLVLGFIFYAIERGVAKIVPGKSSSS